MTADANRCPSPEALERLLGEELPTADRTEVEAHVETCASCQFRLERLVEVAAPLPQSRLTDSSPAHEPDEAFLDRLRKRPPPEPTRALESAEERVPSRLGPYDIIERIGRGGMGTVYKARHRELDKLVAVKVLSANAVSRQVVTRFRTEMKAVGRLDHPNIVAAHDAGQIGDTHFLVTALIDGLDLNRLVERIGPLPLADACELARQAAVGLGHAHDRGLIHRDVKPANLMLARGGVVKVLDLGLARVRGLGLPTEAATASGVLLGTVDYVAPEQIGRAQTADARADVYGLGATLYFLLAGMPPFAGDGQLSWLDKLRAHQETPVPPLRERRAEVPRALAALVEAMLAKEPGDRPASMGEVARSLLPFAAGADLPALIARAGAVATDTAEVSVTDFPHAVPPVPARSRRWKKVLRFAAVAVALLGVALAAVFLWREYGRVPDPVRVLGVEVRQVRTAEANPVGVIGVDRKTIELNDAVRFTVKFSGPAYCYLVAFNPDGKEQLCHPEGETVAPAKVAELQFPRAKYFVLDQEGLQAFVLVASSRPLPPYSEWRDRAGAMPWQKTELRESGGVWRFDGEDWAELVERWEVMPVSKAVAKAKLPDFMKKPSGGGHTEVRGKQPPKSLTNLAEFFRGRPEFDAVQVLSFPVFVQR